MALKYADSTQREVYEADAKAIDSIQKRIIALSNQEEPYAVFICYKETDENGKRTTDSVLANDIYYQLTDKGYKVFYAAITLEEKLGSEYEPIIFSALNTAKVMLVIGTKEEYFNAVWVKNEWSRFLKMMKNDRSKHLFPCYRDIDPYNLPAEFAHLQGQDMSKIGFITDLIRGIEKIIPHNQPQNQESFSAPAVPTAPQPQVVQNQPPIVPTPKQKPIKAKKKRSGLKVLLTLVIVCAILFAVAYVPKIISISTTKDKFTVTYKVSAYNYLTSKAVALNVSHIDEGEDDYQYIVKQFNNSVSEFTAYDLSLLSVDNGNVSNNLTKNVSLRLSVGFNYENATLYHIDESGKLVKVDAVFSEFNKTLTFETTQLGTFIIVEEFNSPLTVTLNANGGAVEIDELEVYSGSQLMDVPVPTK